MTRDVTEPAPERRSDVVTDRIVAFVDEGLGHSSYLVDLGDGRALVVDPSRFPTGQRACARALGLHIVFTMDTHLHADYVSGSPELAECGATLFAPASAGLEVAHRALAAGDEVAVGEFVLRAIATPGHTPDHLAYLLLSDDEPLALFSGGSLMVSTVGRTDLLGVERTERLARDQYRSVHSLLDLPDDLAVYPTHGAGSFCSSASGAARTTTIGRERETNPLLQLHEDEFVARAIAGFGSLPAYFGRLPEVNRRGPRIFGAAPRLDRVSPDAARAAMAIGAKVVDARPIAEFAAAHLPGSVSNAHRPAFATWLASTVPADRPIIFVVDDAGDAGVVDEIVRRSLNVGHEHLLGVLDGGLAAWQAAGFATASIALVAPAAVSGRVIDVRQADEYRAGHLPGAINIELEALAGAELSGVTFMCGHGERAMTAASLVARRGQGDVLVMDGGPDEWSDASGVSLETGG